MEVDFTSYVNDSVRILILLNATKNRKSVIMTERKIMLYDYYLKFPYTMLYESEKLLDPIQTLDEYYAFFHWQPDILHYRQSINYLIAKGFVEKTLCKNSPAFSITARGSEAIEKIATPYMLRMINLTETFIPIVSKWSDTRIEEEIRTKSNILLRNGSGVK